PPLYSAPVALPARWTAAEKRVVSLLAPMLLYDISLQTARIVEHYPSITVHTEKMGSMDWLALLASPVLYHLGLAMLCAGAVVAGPWLVPRESGKPRTEAWRATAMALAGLPVAAIGLLPVASHAADASMVREPVLELIASSRDVEAPPAAPAQFPLEVTPPAQ